MCEPAFDIDHATASKSDQLFAHQVIGSVEIISEIPWSVLGAELVGNLVNLCRMPLYTSMTHSGVCKYPAPGNVTRTPYGLRCSPFKLP